MTLEEFTVLLEELESISFEDRKKLNEEYKETIRKNIWQLDKTDRSNLINRFSSVLYDVGAIGKGFLTPEDKEKRRLAAMNAPKYTHNEEIIMEIFQKTFNEDMVWLKSKKSFSKFRNKGIKIFPPTRDSNLVEGYLWLRQQGYSICLKSGFPYFYIYVDEKKEDIFLYLEKKEEIDSKSIELNKKAIQFLTRIQEAFTNRTPDTIYLSSSYEDCEENGKILWTETSINPERLISYTNRVTSGFSNIISLSDEMVHTLEEKKPSVLYEVSERNKANGNSSTINMLFEIRTLFDEVLTKNDKPIIHQKKYGSNS